MKQALQANLPRGRKTALPQRFAESTTTCYAARVNWTRYAHISWTIPVNCPRTTAILPIGEAGGGFETRHYDNYPA